MAYLWIKCVDLGKKYILIVVVLSFSLDSSNTDDEVKHVVNDVAINSARNELVKETSTGNKRSDVIGGNRGPPGLWGKDQSQRDQQILTKQTMKRSEGAKTASATPRGPPGLIGRKRSLSPITDIMIALKKIQNCQKNGSCTY